MKIHLPPSWLAERAYEKSLNELLGHPAESAAETAHETRISAPILPGEEGADYDTDIQPGQVRILPHAECLPVNRAPIYLLVLKANEGGQFLVAPFSQFGEPVVQGEYRTSLAANGDPTNLEFRTVCLWNAFLLPSAVLEMSWCLGNLPDGDFKHIRKLRHWLETADPSHPLDAAQLPEELQQRIGPPTRQLDGLDFLELEEYLSGEEDWAVNFAEYAAQYVESPATEAAADAREANANFLPFSWKNFLQEMASVPSRVGDPAKLADRFAVWLSEASIGKFLHQGEDTPAFACSVRLMEEATAVWNQVTPELRPKAGDGEGLLVWKKEETVVFTQGGQYEEAPVMSFFGRPSGAGSKPAFTVKSEPKLPEDCPVLLIDGQTSELLGQGTTSKEGVTVTLQAKHLPDSGIQMVVFPKNPPG